MKKKGQLTIPDLLAVFLLLFVFLVLSPVLTNALGTAFIHSNPLTKAILVIILPTILLLIVAALWTLQEPVYEVR